jgi:hypothetical protein
MRYRQRNAPDRERRAGHDGLTTSTSRPTLSGFLRLESGEPGAPIHRAEDAGGDLPVSGYRHLRRS